MPAMMPPGIIKSKPAPMTPPSVNKRPLRQPPGVEQEDPGPRLGGPFRIGPGPSPTDRAPQPFPAPPPSGPIYANPNTPAGPPSGLGPPHMVLPREQPFIPNPGSGNYAVGGGTGGGAPEGGDGGAPQFDSLGDAFETTVPEWMLRARPMEQNISGTGMPIPGGVNPMTPANGGGVLNLPPNPGPYTGNTGTRDPQTPGVASRVPPEIQALGPRFVEMYNNQRSRGNNNPGGIIARARKKSAIRRGPATPANPPPSTGR